MPRCSCLTRNNRKCRLSSIFNINSQRFCKIHAKIKYNDNAILIQKTYRGYKTRNKVNIIMKRVPDDIRNIISYYMREDLYYKKYNDSIEKIITKKTISLLGPLEINTAETLIDYLIQSRSNFNDYNLYYKLNYYKDISHLYKLYLKYYPILYNEYLAKLFNFGRIVRYLFETAVLTNQIRDENNVILIIDSDEYLKMSNDLNNSIHSWKKKLRMLSYHEYCGFY
tara:strand:+ start:4574 stop:5248 length:675 start_codon:yes stop_codon:yes gene_type:complete